MNLQKDEWEKIMKKDTINVRTRTWCSAITSYSKIHVRNTNIFFCKVWSNIFRQWTVAIATKILL